MATGPRELLTQICTLDDVVRNAQVQQEINNLFFEVIDSGGAGDTYKVKVNIADVAPDYLHAKLFFATTDDFDSNTDVAVYSYTDSDSQEKLHWRADDITGFDVTKNLTLTCILGSVAWSEFSGSIDNYTVKCTTNDTTASFLHDACNHPVAYVENADLVVGNATQNGGANETELFFVDVSSIQDWHATEVRILGLAGNISQYFSIEGLIALLIDGGLLAADNITRWRSFVMGTVSSDTLASATTFDIATLTTLAGGLDPGSDPLTITNTNKQNFAAGEKVIAVFDGTVWRTLPTERFRALRGVWDSGTSTLQVKQIVVLESGLDPRTDPTSTTEAIEVLNLHNDTYSTGDVVTADYNVKDERWEARQKNSDGSVNLRFGKTTSVIGAASGWALVNAGEGTFQRLDNDGLADGDEITIKNRYFDSIPVDTPCYVDGTLLINAGCRPGPSS